MQKHQKYFAVTSMSTGNLLPYFIAVRGSLLVLYLTIELCILPLSLTHFSFRLPMVPLKRKLFAEGMKLFSGYAKAL